ncbi:NAD(P)-binding domain-containing protein [Terrimonas sp. NA20]|uniref:NAD(P)-binding domain-containing protein n=2 Tax=Terrimonas ginsenosidimutans TaxID=2908004 RepID=A0ABS9KVH5_9BACT|nr:NAD(P)-binding domain-containing protein [Terrimonas ginsenosidimutans]MCG2616313.1 NAD(P)-binding domain-containing protein [Terrimonas ginsenosidimutans]
MTKTSTIAVVGLGSIGRVVAANIVKAGSPVLVAERTLAKAQKTADELGSLAIPLEIRDAIAKADIIVPAIYFDGIQQFLKAYASELNGKLIIDPSNPIAPDEKGGFKKIIPQDQSSGQVLASILPAGARFAKALGSLGAESLSAAAFGSPEQAVLFYAADDAAVNGPVEDLIRAVGFEPLRIGGIDQSIRMEVFGDLHQFGALGKTVTLAEAKTKI